MVLGGEHARPDWLARFRAEAEAVARLQHPNVIQIFDIGEHSGLPYFSLEYAEGGSLAQRLDGTPWPPEEAARLLKTLARAVQAAHERGIVHRDLKPGNVLLAGDGTPKVADFGLAKQIESISPATASAVVGTPCYMAPEQAKMEKVGPAADIYALGAILYELLTGRPPFRGPTQMDTLMQVMAEEPVPPSRLQPKLPRDLETICLKCLQKDSTCRYARADALGDDLDRFLASEPVQAKPQSTLARAVKWVKRHPGVAALVTSLVVALVLVFALLTGYFAIQANRSNQRALRAMLEKVDLLRVKEDAIQKQRETALRFVKFIRQDPALARLPADQLVKLFLRRNPDLSPRDLDDALVSTPPSAVGFATPNMIGN
jgi:serine/threonine-protein kinase